MCDLSAGGRDALRDAVASFRCPFSIFSALGCANMEDGVGRAPGVLGVL